MFVNYGTFNVRITALRKNKTDSWVEIRIDYPDSSNLHKGGVLLVSYQTSLFISFMVCNTS